MKVGFITNLRAPYRTLQLNEFAKIDSIDITAYYCNDKNKNRNWNTGNKIDYKEVDLIGYKLFNKYGYINKGIYSIIKENDVIILGGYEQPTYILISMMCKLLNKSYILLFDGISVNRLSEKENIIKKYLKKFVISNAKFIMGNGKVSKKYFNEKFKYEKGKIYNQYLSIDSDTINKLYENRNKLKRDYRTKFNIAPEKKVLLYSGRLIDIKNVNSVVRALAKIKNKDIIFLITGGGELAEKIKQTAIDLNIDVIITGFIKNQEELFKHYFMGDAFILPSIEEPWGLVVNEAMTCGLPVIVSNRCGCSLDLVEEGKNGYLVDPVNIDDIANKIKLALYDDNILNNNISKQIIEEYTFSNSRKNLEKILHKIKNKF